MAKDTPVDRETINPVEYCKSNFPAMTKRFKEIQAADFELFCKKQMDYGPGNITMGSNLNTEAEKKLSLTALIIRINDKVQRLINMVIKHNREAANEPVEDAFLDLTIYGIIARLVKEGTWGK